MTASLISQIEKALDDLRDYEEGMRFQRLAVSLAKDRWPDLIASEWKKDNGADALIQPPACGTGDGKVLACSVTPALSKIRQDAQKIKKIATGSMLLIFATTQPVSNDMKESWSDQIRKEFEYELVVISREDLITSLVLPKFRGLCRELLYIDVPFEKSDADQIETVRAAAAEMKTGWLSRLKEKALLDLRLERIDDAGHSTQELFQLKDLHQALTQGRRMILQAPAGAGKTTTLIQLAGTLSPSEGTPFLIQLPEWLDSGKDLLSFISGLRPFQSRSVTPATLAKVYEAEKFFFLLNGWNEISEEYTHRATAVLNSLDRDFSMAAIAVATRDHYVKPELPGALDLRILPLNRKERKAYLDIRLEKRAEELRPTLEGNPILDILTRTPFILSKITTIFEAGKPIPSSKMGVLSEIIHLFEESPEHRNFLQSSPLWGHGREYLGGLAASMTLNGMTFISETMARQIIHETSTKLESAGQIAAAPEPSEVLSILSARHILERLGSQAAQFQHQQFQEFYNASDIRDHLWKLDAQKNERDRQSFIKKYVNEPVWAEPLRIIAEDIGSRGEKDRKAIEAGKQLIGMALEVDPVFAAELAQLCGRAVWNEIRTHLTKSLRSLYQEGSWYRNEALAGMLASGSDEFKDVLIPLLTSDKPQIRLNVYRAWEQFHLSSLGEGWQSIVGGWAVEARVDFVSEILHRENIPEVVAFALDNSQLSVRMAAIQALCWSGSDEEVSKLLEPLDAETFEAVVGRLPINTFPESTRARILAIYQKLVAETTDLRQRVQLLLKAAELDEKGLEDPLKDELEKLDRTKIVDLKEQTIWSIINVVRKTDVQWASHWVAEKLSDGALWSEDWIQLVSSVPGELTNRLLDRLGGEDLGNCRQEGMVSVLTVVADAVLVKKIFSKLCAIQKEIAKTPNERHVSEWAITRQLENLFRALAPEHVAAGLKEVFSKDLDLTELEMVSRLFNIAGQPDASPHDHLNIDLSKQLRAYLKKGLSIILDQKDWNGQLKANFASALSRVGKPEDIADLEKFIHKDIERIRTGRMARASGDHSEAANGATMGWSSWNVKAVIQLDSQAAEEVLLKLLKEPEYESDAAWGLSRLALASKQEERFGRKNDYQAIWQMRAGQKTTHFDEGRRKRFGHAIRARLVEISLERPNMELTKALAVIDGPASVDLIMDLLLKPLNWIAYARVEALESLLFGGALVPTDKALKLADLIVDEIRSKARHEELWLITRLLCLLPFIDNPTRGIEKVQQLILANPTHAHDLGEIAMAMSYSRCDKILDFLKEIAPKIAVNGRLPYTWILAVTNLDTDESRRLLLSFVDPEELGLSMELAIESYEVPLSRIAEALKRDTSIEKHLQDLCHKPLPSPKRLLLAKIMGYFDSIEDVSAGLHLMNDGLAPPIPDGIEDLIKNKCIERRPPDKNPNVYSLVPRNANKARIKLFEMALKDPLRKRSASMMLGFIEDLRLSYGKPISEPRHPLLESGTTWPISEQDH